jgi:predicted SAM-dependent methyltransferase
MKVDVGSGGYKRLGYIGLDIVPPDASLGGVDAPTGLEADVVCDIEHDRWPFEDNSVTHIFSSHTLEHVRHLRIPYIFSEMSRICSDGAEIEI